MKFFASLSLCAPLVAQTLQIMPSTAAPGKSGSLVTQLDSPAGKEPVALQWTINLGTELTVAAADIVVGDTAGAAGKSVTCAAVAKASQPGLNYICILVGGVRPIANGRIFQVKYQVKQTTTPQILKVHVYDCLGVLEKDDQMQKEIIPAADGTITVH
jgi:hypothetical protein